MEKNNELKKAKTTFIIFAALSAGGILLGLYFFFQIMQIEQGYGGTVTLPKFIYGVYQIAGKWGVLASCWILGITCFFAGKKEYNKKKIELE